MKSIGNEVWYTTFRGVYLEDKETFNSPGKVVKDQVWEAVWSRVRDILENLTIEE